MDKYSAAFIAFLGDPALLHHLIRDKKVNMGSLRELDAVTLKQYCHECGIRTSQKSLVIIHVCMLLLHQFALKSCKLLCQKKTFRV